MAALHPQLVQFTIVLRVGVAAVANVYQTARLGGELVYAYAGGVGIRSGDRMARSWM